jgi:hypothetical protein
MNMETMAKMRKVSGVSHMKVLSQCFPTVTKVKVHVSLSIP